MYNSWILKSELGRILAKTIVKQRIFKCFCALAHLINWVVKLILWFLLCTYISSVLSFHMFVSISLSQCLSVSECYSKCFSMSVWDCLCVCVSLFVSQWVSEWVSECVSTWDSECVRLSVWLLWVYLCERLCGQTHPHLFFHNVTKQLFLAVRLFLKEKEAGRTKMDTSFFFLIAILHHTVMSHRERLFVLSNWSGLPGPKK